VFGFLQAVNDNNLPDAVQYLDTKLPEEKAEHLAIELKEVLDANLTTGINRISKDAQGNTRDSLRIAREKIGVAKTPKEQFDILLDRIDRQDGASIWLFSAETLVHIPAAYATLQKHDLSSYFPDFFNRVEFFGLPLWRWVSILISGLLAVILSRLVARLVVLAFRLFLHQGHIDNEEEVIGRLKLRYGFCFSPSSSD
jgi:MscS family membrane protein